LRKRPAQSPIEPGFPTLNRRVRPRINPITSATSSTATSSTRSAPPGYISPLLPDYSHPWDESAPDYSPRRFWPTDDEYLWRTSRNIIEMINSQGYTPDELQDTLAESLHQAIRNGIISPEEAVTLADYVENALRFTGTGYENFARRIFLVRAALSGPNNVERVRNLLQNIRASPDPV